MWGIHCDLAFEPSAGLPGSLIQLKLNNNRARHPAQCAAARTWQGCTSYPSSDMHSLDARANRVDGLRMLIVAIGFKRIPTEPPHRIAAVSLALISRLSDVQQLSLPDRYSEVMCRISFARTSCIGSFRRGSLRADEFRRELGPMLAKEPDLYESREFPCSSAASAKQHRPVQGRQLREAQCGG